jgi:hypothetical protein
MPAHGVVVVSGGAVHEGGGCGGGRVEEVRVLKQKQEKLLKSRATK